MSRVANFEDAFDIFKTFVFHRNKKPKRARVLLKHALDLAQGEDDLRRIRFVIEFGQIRAKYNGTFKGMLGHPVD